MEKLTLSELHTKLLNADSEINKTIIKKDIQQKENEIVKKLFLVLNDEELTITQATSLLQTAKQEILETRLRNINRSS